ncbi:nuclear transport factor 2 family protein [Mycolicibacterium arenosum]|uniref:Nuclear transport factor 2 family protein n=1 Tax=Mycolicibacterium arenosum TaxID=2952157 RepID=A0ABT1M1K1_9MYCO|nr:nuclear transport factor 2 family protein [Mycolicibacterium sp. CAU 1645]MCP9273023.1 nuclear transport factor 2 family protein [Mycolicibacterium sp. CAU 1645]
MSFGYQQERVLAGVEARAAILNLNARHNRLFSAGDRAQWIATFKHTGATLTIGAQTHSRIWDAFDGGSGRLVTVDHEIDVDGVNATQHCVAIRFDSAGTVVATGTYTDVLIYERGGWYYSGRILTWDTAA